MKKSKFSTYVSLYLANDRRYGHSYNGKRIGTYAIYRMVPFAMTLSDS